MAMDVEEGVMDTDAVFQASIEEHTVDATDRIEQGEEGDTNGIW